MRDSRALGRTKCHAPCSAGPVQQKGLSERPALAVAMTVVTRVVPAAFSLLPVLISIPLRTKRQVTQPIPSKILVFTCAQTLHSHQLLTDQAGIYSDTC